MLRVREELLIEYACPHMPPTDMRCHTCRQLREIGYEIHCELLTTNSTYAQAWGRKLQAELRLFRLMRVVPWIDLGVDVVFFWHAYGAIILGMAIAHNEHGSYKHAVSMFLDAAIACGSYLMSEHIRKRFT